MELKELTAKQEDSMLEEARDDEKDDNGYSDWLSENKTDLCHEFCEEQYPDEFQKYCKGQFEQHKQDKA